MAETVPAGLRTRLIACAERLEADGDEWSVGADIRDALSEYPIEDVPACAALTTQAPVDALPLRLARAHINALCRVHDLLREGDADGTSPTRPVRA